MANIVEETHKPKDGYMKSWMLSIKAAVLAFAIVLAPSCGNNAQGLPTINGVGGPTINIVDGKILITFELLNMQVDAGLGGPIPKMKNSRVDFMPNALNGGMIFQASLDVQDLTDLSVVVGDGNYLPDGRPVPGIPGGKLENSLRVDTNWHDVSVYYHKELFGFWIPVGFETAGISGYWNMYYNNKNVAFLGLVGNDEVRDYKAGAIFLLRLQNLKDAQLKKLLKMSERNPHLIY